MGTNSKTTHQPYSISPSIATDDAAPAAPELAADSQPWISEAETGDAMGAVLEQAVAKLPAQPQTLHDLLFGGGLSGNAAAVTERQADEATEAGEDSALAVE